MEFIFKKMDIIIKENGKMIIFMDKEFLFGIMVIHIEGNGRIIKDMVMVLLIKIMENLTKEIFFMIKKKVKEEKFFKMEMFNYLRKLERNQEKQNYNHVVEEVTHVKDLLKSSLL